MTSFVKETRRGVENTGQVAIIFVGVITKFKMMWWTKQSVLLVQPSATITNGVNFDAALIIIFLMAYTFVKHSMRRENQQRVFYYTMRTRTHCECARHKLLGLRFQNVF
jgi:hypothetical protein